MSEFGKFELGKYQKQNCVLPQGKFGKIWYSRIWRAWQVWSYFGEFCEYGESGKFV
jgi:hypothetical protein